VLADEAAAKAAARGAKTSVEDGEVVPPYLFEVRI
jgi:hypothetical protein